MPSPLKNESAQLAAVRHLGLLDTEPDAEFDSIVQAAAALCGMPMCVIALFDEHRFWFKANIGMPSVEEVAHDAALYAHCLDHDDLQEVSDCTQHAEFKDNPYVDGKPHIRFYAGIALSLKDGTRVGTLCVMDTKPAVLSEMQRLVFTHLSQAASRALDSRSYSW